MWLQELLRIGYANDDYNCVGLHIYQALQACLEYLPDKLMTDIQSIQAKNGFYLYSAI